jgi:hypothetical protein
VTGLSVLAAFLETVAHSFETGGVATLTLLDTATHGFGDLMWHLGSPL